MTMVQGSRPPRELHWSQFCNRPDPGQPRPFLRGKWVPSKAEPQSGPPSKTTNFDVDQKALAKTVGKFERV